MPEHFDFIRLSLLNERRRWTTKENILNALPTDELTAEKADGKL